MKRSKLTYDEWECIISKAFKLKESEVYGEKMYLALNCIKEVSEPQIWKFNGENIIVCDKDIRWLSILPQAEKYCITAMMNSEGEVALWYIDMIASWGIDEKGVPYFDDLYLDLVVYPDGTIIVDDREELEEAYQTGKISEELYELALETSVKLQKGLLASIDAFCAFTQECYLDILQK